MRIWAQAAGWVLAACMALPAAAGDDWEPGEKLTFINCGRCHVIGPRNRMGGIGSTPKFSVLRASPDWEDRMRGFYALRPHPAFTQVPGVTQPFPIDRPSAVHPITLTLDEIEIIVEFARRIPPLDLGAARR